jgi:hypothetical protein
MSNPFLPSWEEIEAEYLRIGMPGEFVLREAPRATVTVGANQTVISASFEIDSPNEPIENPLRGLELQIITQNGRFYYRLSVTTRQLFRPFFHFAIDLVYSIKSVNGATVAASITAALTTWAQLFEQRPTLTAERQLGLYGELSFLQMLIAVIGAVAVESWTGPSRASHDFRLATMEFEVKTTYRDRRLHEINGLNQLQASRDFSLFLISFRVAIAGSGGELLADAVQHVRCDLSSEPKALNEFEVRLALAGYVEENAALYSNRFKLADDPRITIVDEAFPRLTLDGITKLNSSYDLQRVFVNSYIIDATGLGQPLDIFHLKKLLVK